MAEAFLEIKNLTKRFGGLMAVRDVNFEVRPNEMVALIGPNGAGKSTVLRLITAILKPTSGVIKFKGEDITNKSTAAIINRCFGILWN
jgi:branched-chain amino acid transport system ATP-binding protein